MKRNRLDSGVSLIEALVALAIMSFGMLGVIGMQATLRFNADASKQRSEAVRLAQEEVERWRAFTVLANTPGQLAFDDIATTAAATVTLSGSSNTSYTLTTDVTPLVAGDPLLKKVTVSVSWLDRRAVSSTDVQAVALTTTIAGIAPELAGSLGIPGDQSATQRPLERHPAIPQSAVNQGDGTSNFAPPGGGSVFWRFSNATGQITNVCNPTCGLPINAWLLSGFVHFAVTGVPTAAIAEAPSDPWIAGVGVSVRPALIPKPASFITDVVCFTSTAASTFISYYCLVPSTAVLRQWSGRAEVTGLSLATTVTDPSSAPYKVCRYTSVLNHATPGGNNMEHPLDYVDVNTSLSNQNFLVIKAGDGTAFYPCPDDVPGNLVNSTTFQHQPA